MTEKQQETYIRTKERLRRLGKEKQSGDCKIYNSHILHLITYEEDRLNYFTDLMEKAQKSFDRLNKRFEKSPHLFVGTDLLSDAGRELQFCKDVVAILKQGYRKQSEWISVDERLPHSQQMVIGFTPCDGYMFIGFYQKVESPYYKSYWNIITSMRSTRKMTKKVTHWMPLPEAPKRTEAVE